MVTPWRDLNVRKTPMLSHQDFFFGDKRFAISNRDLIKDIYRIIKLQEVLSPINNLSPREKQ
jgi:hypothetical protein